MDKMYQRRAGPALARLLSGESDRSGTGKEVWKSLSRLSTHGTAGRQDRYTPQTLVAKVTEVSRLVSLLL